MNREKLFLDTVFIQALLNPRDQYHLVARAFLPRVRVAAEVWLMEAILIEVGNGLSAIGRRSAVQFIQNCYTATNMKIVTVDTSLLIKSRVKSLSVAAR